MEYRNMKIQEVERIKEIDALWYIKRVWRVIEGQRQLVQIDWTETELPNGMPWHMEHYSNTLENGGVAFGCFMDDKLIGYATLNAEVFGSKWKYVLLDQMFISKDYRGHGIGKQFIAMCKEQARNWDADKIYVCAASAEDTIAFYQNAGFRNAMEVNKILQQADPNDWQMELQLK